MPFNVTKTDLFTCPVVVYAEPAKVVYRPMPSSSNNFVGRADCLARLETMFMEERSQAGSRPVGVLSGLGGVGKTQISARFAETRSHL
jgi:hypothetical protein